MQPSAMVTHFPGLCGYVPFRVGPGGFLFHGVHADAGFDESQCLDAVDTHILVGMVRVLAHQLDAAVVFGFLDVFHRYVLLSVDIYREQVHVAPKMSSMLFIFLYSTMSPLLSKGYMLSPTM